MTTPATRQHSRAASQAAPTPGPSTLQPETTALPPPQTFDFLPPLYSLLSRLLLPSGGLQPGPGAQSSADGTTGAQPTSSPSQPGGADGGGGGVSGTGHLDIHDLGAAASAIKVRIQKARVAVARLPDMERGVGEQEEEIRALEERIQRQRDMLRGLGRQGAAGGEEMSVDGR